MHRTMHSIAVAFLSLLAAPLAAQQPAKPPIKIVLKTDADLIQGKWICVKQWEHGIENALPNKLRAVFLQSECKFSGLNSGNSFQYKIDFWKSPKRIDFTEPLAEFNLPAIYELTGDTLKIATSDDGAPKDFQPSKRGVVTIYQRAEKVLAEQGGNQPKALSPEELAALASLRKDLARLRQLLEDGKYEEFVREFSLASEVERYTSSAQAMLELLRHYKKHGPILAKFIKLLEAEVPTFSFDCTKAYFDTRLLHVEGMPGYDQLRLEQIDGKWRSRDK